MEPSLERRLTRLIDSGHSSLLKGGRVGIEKESLRVNKAGGIALTSHPARLGSALAHPHITTDYSEALLELITPPLFGPQAALNFLQSLQKFVYDRLDDEILWGTSMPCVLRGDEGIPIAQYGSSHAGRMKTLYRVGLGYRYGRVMQVIAGVHFNYSLNPELWPLLRELEQDRRPLPEFISAAYMGLIRNLQRIGWLIPYLFGASPAVCKSFFHGKATFMPEFDAGTYYEPYATSLRMGDIGYTNRKEGEAGIKADYSSLEAYVESLRCAINKPYPPYQRIGVKVGGQWRQLNANVLQIENEYYSTIRPKQLPEGNEKPTDALSRGGIRYVELRSLDINAFHPLGIDLPQLRFLEALLITCLLWDSPPIDARERHEIDRNQSVTAHRGRDPGLLLYCGGRVICIRDRGREILDCLGAVCAILDEGEEGTPYTDSLADRRAAFEDPDATPSAQMLATMKSNNEGFYQLARRLSLEHESYFKALPPLDSEHLAQFESEVERSLSSQREIEANDRGSFDDYLEAYFKNGQ